MKLKVGDRVKVSDKGFTIQYNRKGTITKAGRHNDNGKPLVFVKFDHNGNNEWWCVEFLKLLKKAKPFNKADMIL